MPYEEPAVSKPELARLGEEKLLTILFQGAGPDEVASRPAAHELSRRQGVHRTRMAFVCSHLGHHRAHVGARGVPCPTSQNSFGRVFAKYYQGKLVARSFQWLPVTEKNTPHDVEQAPAPRPYL